MTAFSAVKYHQFHCDVGRNLGLGYVSEIRCKSPKWLCPKLILQSLHFYSVLISAAITAALIYVAFEIERLQAVWTWMKKIAHGKTLLVKSLEDVENPPPQKNATMEGVGMIIFCRQ